ncbi:putative RNA-directed DNA polymerase, partial [Tanacetum coccineum]
MAVKDDVNSSDDNSSKPKIVIDSLSDLNLSFGDPLYLHPNDTSGTPIVTIKLTGTENYKMWNMCNSVVVTWILNFLSFELFAGAIYTKTASEMWNDLKETYDKADGSAVFNLHKIINSLNQNGSTLTDYYNNLNSLWKQFDAMVSLSTCTFDAAKHFDKHNQLIKLMQFLVGLDESYLAIRSNLLTREHLPNVKTAFSDKWNFNSNSRPVTNNNASADVHSNGVSSNNATTSNSPVSLSSEQLVRLMNLLNENSVSTANANMADFIIGNISLGWIVDFGANQHMTVSVNFLSNVVDISNLGLIVGHPNGTQALITKIGDLKINNEVTLYDVLVVPEYTVSLLSVHKLSRDNKLFVGFDESNCYIQDLKANRTVGIGKQYNGLYLFDVDNACKIVSNNCIASSFVSKTLWHQRLGHPADQVLDVLKTTLNLDSHSNSDHLCDTCNKAKQTREPFPLSNHKTTKIGELVHLDVWGPYKITSRDGFRYFLTIVDDFSRAVWVYMLKGKDDVYDSLISFVQMFLNQFEMNIKVFRSDNGTEFINNRLQTFFNDKGILHQTTCVYTPQQNGIPERKHGHLLNVARSLMFQEELPLYLWSEYILTAVYIINRIPSLVDVKFYETVFPFKMKNNLKQTEFESGVTKDLNHKNFFDNENPKRPNDEGRVSSNDDNLELSSDINQGNDDSGATSMDETNNTHPEGTVHDETDFINDFYGNLEFNYETEDLPVHTLRRSSRQTKLPSSLNDFIVEGKSVEPICYEEAILDSNWIDGMNAEIEALNENHTWEITDLPPNRKAIRNKWIYKIKYKSSGDIDRYKARLVVKGFNKKEGIDFDETFSPVVKMSTVRYEDIYMTIPKGFASKDNKNKVCKLVKSLYGLKQAPRKWNEKLVYVLKENGFVQSSNDHSLFTKSKTNKFIALLVYVDDIVITGNCLDEIDKFKIFLKSKFKIKDLGHLKYFLGIE